jgi:DNA-binding MarR family transcriptional regulator
MAARAVSVLYDAHLAASGLTASQLTILWCVVATEPMCVGAIGRRVAMDKSAVTRGVALLTERGLLRASKGRDARQRLVSSTARGRRAFELAMPAWRAAQAEAARLLGAQHFKDLAHESLRAARKAATEHVRTAP